MREYRVHAACEPPRIDAGWNDAAWAGAGPLDVGCFRPESGAHRPRTRARLLHAGETLCGIFRVEDRFVRARYTRFQDPVYEDSCVEIFLQPKPERGYFNFEMNCAGALLASHVTDPRRVPGGFAAFARLDPEEGALVRVRSSLEGPLEPEIREPLEWTLSFAIPVRLLEARVGPIGPLAGQQWRANLFKCGDRTSQPHWAAWSEVDELNFHLPRCFGALRFE